MEGETERFVVVWTLGVASLCYCYSVGRRIPTGVPRLLSLLPVFYMLVVLPLRLHAVHLVGITAFFFTWLAGFKLLLFCFDQGPLSPPDLKLHHFIAIACLPIKPKRPNDGGTTDTGRNRPGIVAQRAFRSMLLAGKALLLVLVFRAYDFRSNLHPYALLALYCLHVYLELELVLALFAAPALLLFGFEMEPQFREPYLTTSLQDFWARRWNLMVTGILRPVVYNPLRRLAARAVGPVWAPMPAVMAAFLVSGLMHELIYYYLIRAPPTWEVTSFFILHGACIVLEKAAAAGVPWRLHRAIAAPLVLGFVVVSAFWLFFPQLLRNGALERCIDEYGSAASFIQRKTGPLLYRH